MIIFLLGIVAQATPLVYLNELRQKSGLIALKSSALLDKSAYNHARYLDRYDKGGHQERHSKPFATGRDINDRAKYVGYKASVDRKSVV